MTGAGAPGGRRSKDSSESGFSAPNPCRSWSVGRATSNEPAGARNSYVGAGGRTGLGGGGGGGGRGGRYLDLERPVGLPVGLPVELVADGLGHGLLDLLEELLERGRLAEVDLAALPAADERFLRRLPPGLPLPLGPVPGPQEVVGGDQEEGEELDEGVHRRRGRRGPNVRPSGGGDAKRAGPCTSCWRSRQPGARAGEPQVSIYSNRVNAPGHANSASPRSYGA